jgi:hydroxyacid-oxoacid transhydrogenase
VTVEAAQSVRQWTADHGPAAESVFSWQASPVRFGLGATDEVGVELARLGVRRALVVTDSGVVGTGLPDRVRELGQAASVEMSIWDGVDVEPTDVSIRRALAELKGESFDGFVGVGGGSSLDTCKIINLLLSRGGALEDYVAPPHGGGCPIPGPLQPMIGIPTTAGTGSECSAVAIVSLTDLHVKGAVSDLWIRPALAIVDPLNTLSGPPWVTASAGYDALIQTLESYTSRPFNLRDRPPAGGQRLLYSGSTPISDVWNEAALSLMGRYLQRAILDPQDIDARTGMALGALFSRMGTAGAHVPHSAAYAIAGLVRSYRPKQFGPGQPLVPHGMSVAVTAPAAFDFTYAGAPGRHDRAVRLVTQGHEVDVAPGEALGTWLRQLLEVTGGPLGVDEFGFTAADIPELAAATLTQSRLLTGAPRLIDAESISEIFEASFSAQHKRAEARP